MMYVGKEKTGKTGLRLEVLPNDNQIWIIEFDKEGDK